MIQKYLQIISGSLVSFAVQESLRIAVLVHTVEPYKIHPEISLRNY